MRTKMTMTFIRKATRAKDGKDGVLYRHRWDTGVQELVFASDEEAIAWFKKTLKP